jgi:hypothetical protein
MNMNKLKMLINIGGYDEIVLEFYFVACTIDVSCSPIEVDPSRLYGRSCLQTRLDEPTTSREATVVDAN